MNPRRFSAESTLATLLQSAVIASSLLSGETGFRIKDMRFYFDLISNWLAFEMRGINLSLQTTQLQRHLGKLEKDGLLTRKRRRSRDHYLLSYRGLMTLVASLHGNDTLRPLEEVLFVSYMFSAYQNVLRTALLPQDVFFSPERTQSVLELIDPKVPLKKHQQALEKVIKDYQERMDESRAMAGYAQQQFLATESEQEVLAMVSQHFNYQLSSQRPLEDLYKGMPRHLWRNELEKGPVIRNTQLFARLKTLLEAELEIVKQSQSGA